ncbi:MAG: hypothetical protein ACYC65_15070 [Candidatus Limnocylindrales bacterium]
MASVAHRRVLTAAEVRGRRRVSPAARLGPVGWVFAVIAVLWLGNELRPLLAWGAFDQLNWGEDATLIVRALGDAAMLALPAGLLLGFPAAGRRNRWLLRGVVLVALAQLARPALDAAQQWAFDGGFYGPSGEATSPAGLAVTMLSVATGLLSLAGVWSTSDGLAAAGARPRRAAVIAIAAAAVGVQGAFIVRYVVDGEVNMLSAYGLDLLRIALSLAVIALWFVVAARLLVGAAAGLVPSGAWVVGGIAGGLLLAVQLASTAFQFLGGLGDFSSLVWPVMSIASSAVWVLLLAALAMGLGRDTRHAAGERWRIPHYELGHPAREDALP